VSVKVGLAGFGLAGGSLHSPLLRAAEFEVTCILTSRWEAAMRAWPAARTVSAFDDLLSAPVDLIVIATPNHLHFSQAMAALRAGKAVVLDKPMALTHAECETLCNLAERQERLLTVFHNRRWDSDFLTVAAALKEGLIGRPARFLNGWRRHRLEIRDRWRERPGPGVGLFFDLGPHLIDQTMMLFGPPIWVSADIFAARQSQPQGVDDGFEVVLGYETMRAVLSASSLAAGPQREMRLDGTLASLVLEGFDPQEPRLRSGMPGDAPGLGDPEGAIDARLYQPDGSQRPVAMQSGAWPRFYQGVMAALSDGAPPPVDPRAAAAVIRIVEAARESAAHGRRVAL